jgi:hypothetical protein
MQKQEIENRIGKILTGEAKLNALKFVSYLQANDMQFDKQGGYWEDKYYWAIWYKGEIVCFILINNGEDKTEPDGWVVWFEDGDSDCFANFTTDERTKDIAWANVDIFNGDCGGGQCEGLRKVIFGKVFESLYRTIMRFNNPDVETTECMEKLVEIRKNSIIERMNNT